MLNPCKEHTDCLILRIMLVFELSYFSGIYPIDIPSIIVFNNSYKEYSLVFV